MSRGNDLQRYQRLYEEFVEMLRQCEGTLVKVCCTFAGRQPADMADLYQDIVSELWQSWRTFRGKSNVNTWVTRVALNVACEQRRRRQNEPRMVALDETFCSLLVAEAADSYYEQIYAFIERLKPDDRKLIYLYLDRMSYADMAALLHVGEATVRKRLQRAKERLKTLKEQEYE